jgi:hydrogenase/urease accessory protein HupE
MPLTIALTILAAAIPFLGDMPATFVSLLVAAVTLMLGVAGRPFIENAMAWLVIAFSRLVSMRLPPRPKSFFPTPEIARLPVFRHS